LGAGELHGCSQVRVVCGGQGKKKTSCPEA
jgi:hypothetical protein